MPLHAPIASAAAPAAAVVYAGAKRPAATVRKAAVLGTKLKSVDKGAEQSKRHVRQLSNQMCKETAARLLSEMGHKAAVSVACCGSKPRGGSVSLKLNKQTGKASFTGTFRCSGVWTCPSCSRAIAHKRCEELNELLKAARAANYSVHLITLTFRHGRDDDLAAILDGLKKAKQRLGQRAEWRRLPMVGSVTALETTHGARNGWHPHVHCAVVLDAPADQAFKALSALAPVWRKCLQAFGLDGGKAAFDVIDGSDNGAYIGKFGLAGETSLGIAKVAMAGARTPWQLLADATEGDKRAGWLWQEYAKSFAGRRQLVWSPGLKKRFAIGEVSDEQAVEAAEAAENEAAETVILRTFTATEWALVKSRKCAILRAAERGGSIERAMHGPTDRARFLRLQGDMSADVWA